MGGELVDTPSSLTAPPLLAPIPEKGHDLSEDDLKAARLFLREFVVQSLVPWLERAVVVGNEQVSRCQVWPVVVSVSRLTG